MNKIEFLHRLALNEPGCVCAVVCPSLEGLRALWDENISVFVLGATRLNKLERIWKYQNGSIVLFQLADVASQLTRDYLFTYDTINNEMYVRLRNGTRKMVLLQITP